MTRDDYNKALLLILVLREARGTGLDSIRAVAHVVRNRVQAGWGTWNQVMTAHNQFSSMVIRGDPNTVWYPADTDIDNLCSTIENVYDGKDIDLTHGALYYWNPQIATSGWFKDNIADNPDQHPQTGQFGPQVFYR